MYIAKKNTSFFVQQVLYKCPVFSQNQLLRAGKNYAKKYSLRIYDERFHLANRVIKFH